MTAGWTWYVIALVALNILGCVWLIWWTGRRRPGDPATTDTSVVSSGLISEASSPIGPLALRNGQTTAPIAPDVASNLPLAKNCMDLILAG